MEIIKTKTICDVCGAETSNEKIDIQVIFTTEQNEGLCCKPYLCNEKAVISNDCANLLNQFVPICKGSEGFRNSI